MKFNRDQEFKRVFILMFFCWLVVAILHFLGLVDITQF